MKKVLSALPHLCIILSLMFIVFLVLNDYNPSMNFLTNDISLALLWILCGLSIFCAVKNISENRKKQLAEFNRIRQAKVELTNVKQNSKED